MADRTSHIFTTLWKNTSRTFKHNSKGVRLLSNNTRTHTQTKISEVPLPFSLSEEQPNNLLFKTKGKGIFFKGWTEMK